MKRFWPLALLVIFVLAVLAVGTHLEENRQKERSAEPVRATLTVYTDLPNSVTSLLAQQYEMLYHVRIQMMPLTENQLAARMTLPSAEQSGDLVLTSRDNLALAAKYKQFKPVLSEGVDEISDRFKNPDALWVGVWYDPIIFAQSNSFYNDKGRYITTWHSLALPGTWSVVMTDFVASRTAANMLYSFVEHYGEQEGMQYFVNLKPHVVQYAKFLSTPVRLASLGETDIGIGNYSDGQQYISHKYPVKIIFPADGTPYYLTGVGLLQSSKNVEESTRFIKWLLSKQAAQFLTDNGIFFVYTNPEIPRPTDSLGREPALFDTVGGYTEDGKKALLDKWISQVRFRKDS